MPLFEFEAGRLVPAQFGHVVSEPLDDEVLAAVRDQVLELLQRQLFPVTWHDGDTYPRLTALDGSGQVVCVEVLDSLDSAQLVSALGRASRTAARGTLELAQSYPRGVDAFRRDWATFREQLPPATSSGPRLHLLAAQITDDVREAVAAMEGSVLVHELEVRAMSNGRMFIEVTELARSPIELPWVLPGRPTPTLPPTDIAPAADSPASASAASGSPTSAGTPGEPVNPEGAESQQSAASAGSAASADSAVSAQSAASPAANDRPAAPAAAAVPLPPSTSDIDELTGMAMIGRALVEDTPIAWVIGGAARAEAVFTPEGTIRLASGQVCSTPAEATAGIGAAARHDPWEAWRFGEEGPSLAEARDEVVSVEAEASGAATNDGEAAASAEDAGGRRRRRRRRGRS